MKILNDTFLTFDDVLIKPNFSKIQSRSLIDLGQTWGERRFRLPIISANMDYVTGIDMAEAMADAGGFGILHRFGDFENVKNAVHYLHTIGLYTSISVGIRDRQTAFDHITALYGELDSVAIDVAHGYHEAVGEMVFDIKETFPALKIIAGNVATAEAFTYLANAGADAIKVGIGPGSVCTTRSVTGVGVPQLSAIINCAEVRDAYFDDVRIIADGGIKNSGDIVKALAAGADFVMLGSLLAGHDETPGEPRWRNEEQYKPYRGQSIFGSNESSFSPEGIYGWVRVKGPVAATLKQLAGGIRSGLSYVGASTLTELQEKADFIVVSPGTHLESTTRIQEF